MLSQKEYLKKYLSGEKHKKKKKSKKSEKNVKIIDDDCDVLKPERSDDELILTGEDAPQIVGIIDDRPPGLKTIEDFRRSGKWKSVSDNFSGKSSTNNQQKSNAKTSENSSLEVINQKSIDKDLNLKENKIRYDVKSDLSPRRIRKTRGSIDDISSRHESDYRNCSEDLSPRRSKINLNCSTDISPKRRKNSQDRDEGFKAKRDYSKDFSPKCRKDRRDLSKDLSPRRIKSYRDSSRDISPKRRRNNRDHSEDLSPRKQENSRNCSRDISPKRRKDNRDEDYKAKRDSSRDITSTSRKKLDHNEDFNSKRTGHQKSINYRDDDISPKYRQSTKEDERDLQGLSKIYSHCTQSPIRKTLDGKNAGLQDAKTLKQESEKFRKQEKELFEKMSKDVSGKDAEVAVRLSSNKYRNEKRVNPEEEQRKMKLEKEKRETYNRWGKGLKQIEDYKNKIADEQHEMNKPLARYADDVDLDELLKKQERSGDPMLDYIKKKKNEKNPSMSNSSTKLSVPIYQGAFPENRFNIRPGYRWDGVDRSNGYEKRWFEVQNKKKAMQEEAYRYSTEDM